MMVAVGRPSRLYVIILVLWLGRTANLQKSFQLFRDHHDVFSNSECLSTDDSSGSSRTCSESCSKFDANSCIQGNKDSSYCVCNKDGRNTYMNDRNVKRCVKDEDISPISGCYKFENKAVLQFLSHADCPGSCSRNFSSNNNKKCVIKWSESQYQRHGKAWTAITGEKKYIYIERNNKRIKKLMVKYKALNIWNGSLIKLKIKCKSNKDTKDCMLLKFQSLPKYSQVPTSSKPTRQHHTTQSTLSSKSDHSIESSSTKAIAISIPIILVIILCLVLGFFFIRRQRKRREPELTTNEEEMPEACEAPNHATQSCETPLSTTNYYEDPSLMYEPLKEDRRGTETEQPYQGLVGLDSQGKDTSVYDYIDEKGNTKPGVAAEGEYSYASNENIARPFKTSQSPPSAPIVYQTLEEPETSDNPTLERDGLTDKEQDSKKEPFDQQPKTPVYQTLEEQEAVGNPNLNSDDELCDKSLQDSAVGEHIDQPSQHPVNQMLENDPSAGQDASSEAFGYPSVGDVPVDDPVHDHVLDSPY